MPNLPAKQQLSAMLFLGLSLCIGCSTVTPSSVEKKITQPPSDAFLKKVKNDPFPSASQQGLSTR
jgi:hypothetical protein